MSLMTDTEQGRTWLRQLPATVASLSQQWQLQLIASPFMDGSVSFVIPARRNGLPVVLKVQLMHEECLYEADALELWNGSGAIKLLAHNRELGGLLLEACIPGTSLAETQHIDQLQVIASLLTKLWVPAGAPFKTLEQEARDWQRNLHANWLAVGKPMSEPVFIEVMSFIDELLQTPQQQVLVHQDMHGKNILAAQRDDWLAIDPKPLVGEKAFGLASVIRSAELGHSKEKVIGRLDWLSQELDIDRERARKWAIVQTFVWGLSEGPHEHMVA